MRKKRLLLNTGMAMINQIITLICGFILPQQILLNYGSNVNGLVSSISQFLGFITLMDMGVGAVVQSSLYKPIAEKDQSGINRIMSSANRFFKRIAVILMIYTVVLMILYPALIDDSIGFVSTMLLVAAIAVSSIAQYFFGITNQIFLNADQRSYVQLAALSVSTVLNTAVSIILINAGASINVVKIGAAAVLLSRPAILSIYVRKRYPDINKKIKVEGEPIKQKWNGLAQHTATFIVDRTDVVVLSLMSTLANVSIYNVYHLVVTGLYQLFIVMTSGLQSMFGDMYAKGEIKKLEKTYLITEWISHNTVSIMFGCAGVLMIPFVKLYTDGVTDANYILPVFSWIMSIAYGFCCLRGFYNIIIKAVGHYKETQISAIIEAAVNIIVSVVLVNFIGLSGAAIGTLIAISFRTFYFAYYIPKKIIHCSSMVFIKNLIIDILIIVLITVFSNFIICSCETFYQWVIEAIKMTASAVLISVLVNMIFNRKYCIEVFRYARKVFKIKKETKPSD